VTDILAFLVRHGEVVLFLYVFADQLGVPLPAVPILLAAGGLAGAGRLSFPVAVGLAVIASLVADLIWYLAGRLRGSRVLSLLCRVSLEPDTCVRRTQNFFLQYGVRSLLFAKFIPGLSTVAPPLAGVVGVGVFQFLIYSAASAFLWAGAWMALGYAAGSALERVSAHAEQVGKAFAVALAAVIAAYVVFKWIQRQRLLRSLRIARVSAEELKAWLDGPETPLVVDLRTALDVKAVPYAIPGAVRIVAEDLEQRHPDLPRDREIVLYCS
jgi:membrane protein DedA with SNARE-associated domain